VGGLAYGIPRNAAKGRPLLEDQFSPLAGPCGAWIKGTVALDNKELKTPTPLEKHIILAEIYLKSVFHKFSNRTEINKKISILVTSNMADMGEHLTKAKTKVLLFFLSLRPLF
jgi:hypothetical protein